MSDQLKQVVVKLDQLLQSRQDGTTILYRPKIYQDSLNTVDVYNSRVNSNNDYSSHIRGQSCRSYQTHQLEFIDGVPLSPTGSRQPGSVRPGLSSTSEKPPNFKELLEAHGGPSAPISPRSSEQEQENNIHPQNSPSKSPDPNLPSSLGPDAHRPEATTKDCACRRLLKFLCCA